MRRLHGVGQNPNSHIRTFDVGGTQHLQPRHQRCILKRTNKKDGTVRLSAEYDVTGDDGTTDGYVRIRLNQTVRNRLLFEVTMEVGSTAEVYIEGADPVLDGALLVIDDAATFLEGQVAGGGERTVTVQFAVPPATNPYRSR